MTNLEKRVNVARIERSESPRSSLIYEAGAHLARGLLKSLEIVTGDL